QPSWQKPLHSCEPSSSCARKRGITEVTVSNKVAEKEVALATFFFLCYSAIERDRHGHASTECGDFGSGQRNSHALQIAEGSASTGRQATIAACRRHGA